MGKCLPGTLVAVALILIPVPVTAQAQTIKAVLQDSSTGEPVSFATISITRPGAKSPAKYILSDESGKVSLTGVSAGKYSFKAELMGYKTYTKDIEVGSTALDLGTIKMDADRRTLDAATVSAVGNPIVIKKDTIEYTASSFKTTDNDMLEDLIKKMPGMEVSEDGSVTFNGETITKITIDGRTFFLDDPTLATKNIPSKIVEKLKVINKKSEQAEFTGIDDGEEETIIDLSIQKGMMNGMFGNVMGGIGHDIQGSDASDGDWRYQGAAFIGRFTDTNQLSVILNGNNTNNRGFNDLAGSSMTGMRGGGGGMGRGQGGGGGGNGITTSWMGGLNGNTYLFDNKMTIEGNYLYNGSKRDVNEESSKITYLDDYNLLYDTKGFSNTNTDGHRLGARIEHKFSDNTSILFQPQFNIGTGDYNEVSQTSTRTAAGSDTTNTNESVTQNIGNSKNWQTNGFFLFRQRLGIPGRTLTFHFDYSFSNADMNGYNQSLTTTYDDLDIPADSIMNQRFLQNQKSSSLSGRLTYTEPLGRGFYVEANYQLQWSRNTSWKKTWDSGPVTNFEYANMDYNPTGESYNTTYSNNVVNRYINQTMGVNFMYQKENFRAQLGGSLNPTDTHNETNGETYSSKVLNWAPQAMLFYEMNENSNIRLRYRGRSSQPSTSQLMPVADNTDPLNLSFGNPYLEPYFTHSLRTEYRMSNRKSFTSVTVNLEGSLVQNPIVNAIWYDSSGAQYAMPVNGRNSQNANARVFVNSPIAKSNFSIFSMTTGSYSNSSSYLTDSFDNMDDYYQEGEFDYEKFHKEVDMDKVFDLNRTQTVSAMQRLRFTYRNDIVELNLGGRTRMSKSWYTVASASTNTTWNNQVDASMNWTIPGGITLVTDARYNWYEGYTTAQDDEIILNAEISKLLFKNKATLALKAYDIFSQSKNLTVTDSANYHTETMNNTLGRYIVASLTWRFGSFKNTDGRDNRGPGGGGRPPMGGGRPPM